MKSEKFEVTDKPATDGSIENFMRGEAYQPGSRHALDDKGMGSGIGVPNNSRELPPDERIPEQDFLPPDTSGLDADLADWKARYGNSENEKGQWRKTATEAVDELKRAQTELAQLRAGFNAPPPQPAYQGYQSTAPTYPQQIAPPQQTPVIPETFFPGKEDNDVVEVADVNRMVRELIAPAVLQLHNQQQAMGLQHLQDFINIL